MRLWHKDLIHILPRQQLLGQWRECCAIAKNIAEKGMPGNILVNRIMNYPLYHFTVYTSMVYVEMKSRGYKPNMEHFYKWITLWKNEREIDDYEQVCIFKDWHNHRYLKQCLYNLEEKYDCGGISEKEWDIILKEFPAICL